MFYCTIRWGTFFAARFGADMQWPVGSSPWRPTWRKSCNLASYIPSLEMWINPCLEKKLLKVCQTFLMIHFSMHPTSRNGLFVHPLVGNWNYICICICVCICVCICICVCVLAGACIRITLSSVGAGAHARLQRNRSQSIQRRPSCITITPSQQPGFTATAKCFKQMKSKENQSKLKENKGNQRKSKEIKRKLKE